MKANELMVGDWVRKLELGGHTIPVKVVGVLEDQVDYLRRDEVRGTINIKGIEQIPLTPEILEKNGFYWGYTSQQEDAASQIFCTLPEPMWTYDEGSGSIQIMFPNESDGGEIYLSDQSFDRDLHFVFCENIYVHELQHTLKLLGIEKEIEL